MDAVLFCKSISLRFSHGWRTVIENPDREYDDELDVCFGEKPDMQLYSEACYKWYSELSYIMAFSTHILPKYGTPLAPCRPPSLHEAVCRDVFSCLLDMSDITVAHIIRQTRLEKLKPSLVSPKALWFVKSLYDLLGKKQGDQDIQDDEEFGVFYDNLVVPFLMSCLYMGFESVFWCFLLACSRLEPLSASSSPLPLLFTGLRRSVFKDQEVKYKRTQDASFNNVQRMYEQIAEHIRYRREWPQAQVSISEYTPDSKSDNHYKILGVPQGASTQEISKQYRNLAILHHPDKTESKGDTSFKKIQEAYNCLRDETRRAEYDAELSAKVAPYSKMFSTLSSAQDTLKASASAAGAVAYTALANTPGALKASVSAATSAAHKAKDVASGPVAAAASIAASAAGAAASAVGAVASAAFTNAPAAARVSVYAAGAAGAAATSVVNAAMQAVSVPSAAVASAVSSITQGAKALFSPGAKALFSTGVAKQPQPNAMVASPSSAHADQSKTESVYQTPATNPALQSGHDTSNSAALTVRPPMFPDLAREPYSPARIGWDTDPFLNGYEGDTTSQFQSHRVLSETDHRTPLLPFPDRTSLLPFPDTDLDRENSLALAGENASVVDANPFGEDALEGTVFRHQPRASLTSSQLRPTAALGRVASATPLPFGVSSSADPFDMAIGDSRTQPDSTLLLLGPNTAFGSVSLAPRLPFDFSSSDLLTSADPFDMAIGGFPTQRGSTSLRLGSIAALDSVSNLDNPTQSADRDQTTAFGGGSFVSPRPAPLRLTGPTEAAGLFDEENGVFGSLTGDASRHNLGQGSRQIPSALAFEERKDGTGVIPRGDFSQPDPFERLESVLAGEVTQMYADMLALAEVTKRDVLPDLSRAVRGIVLPQIDLSQQPFPVGDYVKGLVGSPGLHTLADAIIQTHAKGDKSNTIAGRRVKQKDWTKTIPNQIIFPLKHGTYEGIVAYQKPDKVPPFYVAFWTPAGNKLVDTVDIGDFFSNFIDVFIAKVLEPDQGDNPLKKLILGTNTKTTFEQKMYPKTKRRDARVRVEVDIPRVAVGPDGSATAMAKFLAHNLLNSMPHVAGQPPLQNV